MTEAIDQTKPGAGEERRFLFFSLAIFLLALAARWLPGPRTIDDAYITFRYARNILAGNGFVFNLEERVLGTTTPLYTISIVLGGFFSGGVRASFPLLALLINALADAFTCLLLLDIGRKFGAPRAGVGAALLWAIAPFSVTFAIGGLETSLYVLLMTAIFWATLRERYTLAALLAALSLLTRPDALILLGPLALDWLIQKLPRTRTHSIARTLTPSLLRPLIAFVLPLLPWLISATLYFGSPIPHSITAKALAYRLEPTEGLVRLLQHYATPFLEDLTFGAYGVMIGLILYPFLFIVGARRILSSHPRAWPFIVYPWLYFAVFAVANPLIFRWYLTPPLPVYFLVILTGIDHLFQIIHSSATSTSLHRKFLRGKGEPSFPYPTVSSLFVILLPILLSLRGWTLHPDHGSNRPAPAMAWHQLELLYIQAAEMLTPLLTPQSVLAAGDVGALGYFTPARILDTVGLNSPVALSYYPLDAAHYSINYAIAPRLILEQCPDYLIMLEIYGRQGLLKETQFWEKYQLLAELPTDIYGSKGLYLFERSGNCQRQP